VSFDKIDAAKKANLIDFAYNMFQPGVLRPPVDPGIALAGYQFLYYLNANDFHSTEFYGYIAASATTAGAYALVIRGTEDAKEWILDFAAIPVPFTPAPGAGFVALGFLSIYQTFAFIDGAGVSHTLSQVIADLTAKPGGITQFLVLGHSLGAALATLAAAELTIVNPNGVKSKVSIYTYASPRVGFLDFAASFDRAVPTSFRIWNILDIVPQFPTFPYIHVNGFGDSIVQTPEQLEQLLFTPPCQHHLADYQWLLDPAHFTIVAGCADVAAKAHVAAMAAAVGHGPAEHKTSARVLHKAFAGHD
jgi:hypothetical protein